MVKSTDWGSVLSPALLCRLIIIDFGQVTSPLVWELPQLYKSRVRITATPGAAVRSECANACTDFITGPGTR